MVELRTRKGEMSGDGRTHHEKLGLRKRGVRVNLPSLIWQVQVLSLRVITLISGLQNPIRQVVLMISHIRLYPPYCSDVHPPSLFLVHYSTIIAENNVMSSISISPCHDCELILCTACTEYSIHRVQHTLNTASTQSFQSSLHSQDYELTPECSFSFQCGFLQDWPPPASSPWELKGKVTSSHSHSCVLTNWCIESHQHLAPLYIYYSN